MMIIDVFYFSYSCGHLQPGMTVLDVTGQTNLGITKKLQGYADQVLTS